MTVRQEAQGEDGLSCPELFDGAEQSAEKDAENSEGHKDRRRPGHFVPSYVEDEQKTEDSAAHSSSAGKVDALQRGSPRLRCSDVCVGQLESNESHSDNGQGSLAEKGPSPADRLGEEPPDDSSR